jgi:hypothetical protein
VHSIYTVDIHTRSRGPHTVAPQTRQQWAVWLWAPQHTSPERCHTPTSFPSELCPAAASCAASWRRSRRRRWRAWMTAAAPLSPSSARHRPVGSCGAAELVEPGLEFLESRSPRSRCAQIAVSRSEVGGEVVIPAARSAARSAADRLSGARYGRISREGRRDRFSGARYDGRRGGSEEPLRGRDGRQLSSHVESQPT